MPRAGKNNSELAQLRATDPRPPRRRLVYGIEKKSAGRPETGVTKAGLDLIERMSRDGHSEHSIAKSLGIGQATFRLLKQRDPRVLEAIQTGHGSLADELTDILLDVARDRAHKMQVIAAIYLTKARLGWQEGQPIEQRPNVTIVLPDSQSPEDYMRGLQIVHAPKGELPE